MPGGGAPALVVGAGPTGLTLAHELARHGAAVRIIDRAPAASTVSKALAIHARTLEVFDQMGVVDGVLERGQRIEGITLHSGGRVVFELEIPRLDTPYPYLVALPQPDTEASLAGRLEQRSVQVERGVELTGFAQDAEGVTAHLRHADGTVESCRTPYLLGCDGSHSTARHGLGLAFEGKQYPEHWALADVRLESAELAPNRMHAFWLPDGQIMAVFPFRGGRARVMVSTPTPADEATQPDPTLDFFQTAFDRARLGLARVSDPAWLANFRAHLRHCARCRVGRVFLAGDAFHIHSPFGGQGMNTGIPDAHNLAWKLELVLAGTAPPALLDSYEAERQPIAEAVLRLTDTMASNLSHLTPTTKRLLEHALPVLQHLPLGPLQRSLMERIAELGVNYRRGPLTEDDPGGPLDRLVPGHASAPSAGDRVVDAGPAGVCRQLDGPHLRSRAAPGSPAAAAVPRR